MIGLLTIGLVSAAALLLYLRASELLPFGLFGLLTYVFQPVLLAVVSITILGESLTPVDLLDIRADRRRALPARHRERHRTALPGPRPRAEGNDLGAVHPPATLMVTLGLTPTVGVGVIQRSLHTRVQLFVGHEQVNCGGVVVDLPSRVISSAHL